MTEKPLPDVGALLVQVVTQVPEPARARFLALLERTASERYQRWATDLPEHAEGLLACARREIEIAEAAERIFALDEAGREKLDTPLQSAREAYLGLLAELSLRDQLRLQANAERTGGAAWRGIAARLADATARAALERSAVLEEANAAHLDALVARLPA